MIEIVEVVVKLGGGVLAHTEHFNAALAAISAAARVNRLLVVPGGGLFADVVRDIDRRLTLSDDASHWMAVLAMDQYAELLASKLAGGVVVSTLREITVALDAGHVPVLASSRWLREVDPLPHSWDVTSDSIAAWVAGEVGARSLVLIKPPGAHGKATVDSYFAHALPERVTATVVTADRLEADLKVGLYVHEG
jgi:aspartokinase-like uncharacterized kinase